jgi:hypothetical protein
MFQEDAQSIDSWKTRSQASRTSSRSSRSNAAAAMARAEAEAARAKVAYAEKEMQIKIQKAQLEASLDKLNVEKTAAAALAKAEALEAALEYENAEHGPKLRGGSEQRSHNAMQMTEEYVQKHSVLDSSLKPGAQLQGSPTTTQPQQTPPPQAPTALTYQPTQIKPERNEDP